MNKIQNWVFSLPLFLNPLFPPLKKVILSYGPISMKLDTNIFVCLPVIMFLCRWRARSTPSSWTRARRQRWCSTRWCLRWKSSTVRAARARCVYLFFLEKKNSHKKTRYYSQKTRAISQLRMCRPPPHPSPLSFDHSLFIDDTEPLTLYRWCGT